MQVMQVNPQAARRGGGLDYKWILAMVVIFGVFMSILDQTIVNIAIPRLQSAFGADIHSVQWVLTAYILAQGVATPAAAFFADTLGIKRFYIISLTAFTVGSALCGLAWSLPILITFRILQGLGGAALFPLSITLLFREFPPQERGTAMGIFGVPALLAPALGPTLGGYLVTYVGWQAIFYVNVPIGIVAIILATILIREYRPEGQTRFDFPGFFFAALGLAAVLYALSSASTDGWGSGTVLGSLFVGLLSLAIFVTVELVIANRGGQPLLDLRLFANGPFRAGMIANMFVVFGLFGGLFLFPIYLQNIRFLSAFQAGLILLPQALAAMACTIVGGRLVDRIGVRAVMIPGLLVLGFATWQLTYISVYSTYGWLQLMFILRGIALGLTVQPLTVAMLSEISPRQLAQASSLNTVNRAVASSLGIAILATLVQTQSLVHFGHLAERVTASSQLGQLLLGLQAAFVARGADLLAARNAALQLIARFFLQRQAFVLGVQDALRLTIVIIVLAIIAVLFVRNNRRPQRIPEQAPRAGIPAEKEESAPAEAVLAG
ncbi:MAG TPA: DHA2 family efflux MFS transporter permease subunit [Ktedonobacteraceae bacterium]|nr:DHA2 family efflux MFS transporter permease subunit [Ktedonobacteraceae bacterium]